MPNKRRWNLKRTVEDSTTTLRGERTFRLSEVSRGEIALKKIVKNKAQITLVNEATCQKIGPDLWRYREVLRWKGAPSVSRKIWEHYGGTVDSQRIVRRALPRELASETNVRALSGLITRAMVRSLLGPPHPQITQLFLLPDLMANDVSIQVGRQIDAILKTRFGTRLTSAQRYKISREIVMAVFTDFKDSYEKRTDTSKTKKSKKDADESADANDSAVLTFRLRLPGKVVETNGELNPYTGEIIWSLLPEAALLGEIILTATTRFQP